MANRIQVSAVLNRLAAAYPKTDYTDAQIELWVEKFSRTNPDELARATELAIETGEFFPSVARMFECIRAVHGVEYTRAKLSAPDDPEQWGAAGAVLDSTQRNELSAALARLEESTRMDSAGHHDRGDAENWDVCRRVIRDGSELAGKERAARRMMDDLRKGRRHPMVLDRPESPGEAEKDRIRMEQTEREIEASGGLMKWFEDKRRDLIALRGRHD